VPEKKGAMQKVQIKVTMPETRISVSSFPEVWQEAYELISHSVTVAV
jgi:hypothetical protein